MSAELINARIPLGNGLDGVIQEKQTKTRRIFSKKISGMTKEDSYVLSIIENLKADIAIMQQNLDYATDDMLIDCYIYELKALNIKYQYYIKLCKDRGVIARLF